MITIVVSSFRYGHLAAHCVESILSQSKQPEKILFVDDAVGDCRHIKDLYPEVQFFENETNKGTVQNFQDMLSRVDTEYCMFIGADNWLRSDALSMFSTVIELDRPDIITYDIMITGELKGKRILDSKHKTETWSFEGDYFWTRENAHHGSMLYRTSLAKSVGGYTKHNRDPAYTEEDLSLWNKMIAAGAKISHVKHPLLYYRHHRNNYNKY
jgi:glycosyltransferase involved in cell wall biosynthesis